MNIYTVQIASKLQLNTKQVETTILLLEDGGTVPFISRYRKDKTGGLDEVQVTAIRDMLKSLEELDKRKDSILKSIEEQGKINDELRKQIQDAETLTALEDIYLPYRPKRKTKASIAREKGLENLALWIFEQHIGNLEKEANKYISTEKGVNNTDEALSGARDIIAEMINENAEIRAKLRTYFYQNAVIKSTVLKDKELTAIKFKDYFDWEEKANSAPSHRILAMLRGEEEGFLKLEVLPVVDGSIQLIEKYFSLGNTASSKQFELAISDSYKRLLRPSIATDLRATLKVKADEEAIRVFATNARQLLMAAPLGQKNVLAIDPGFRTGCKVVCLNQQGKLLENKVIFPHSGQYKEVEASSIIKKLVDSYAIDAIAIGNGTAGRETEIFIRNLKLDKVLVVMVNESGASIYSASAVAREEFPDEDLTVRGAVSIGRRLMDPLAELVKIDPKSIGVGQYQHDVDQKKLQLSLDDTVMSCVNAVGVELNTASKQLLSYVSGLGNSLAQNIVDFRNKNGAFKNRESLRKVPRLGDKAFEQAAGFLRIHNADNPLDGSGVHPESYHLVNLIANDLKVSVAELLNDENLQQQITPNKYINSEIGLHTIDDVLKEIAKPGRDPRAQFESFSFAEGVNSIDDLKLGMKLDGIITNITNFGAFVDIGVHQDGLVHTSQLANRYISNPNDVVKVGQKVQVTVIEVDVERKRISLSMKETQKTKDEKKEKDLGKRFNKNQNFKFQQKSNPAVKNSKDDVQDLKSKLDLLKQKFGN